ncbi:MAG: hypothetical protein QG608_536 [Actinomycetota bacterium]|nr:hypothetical protein [Actinomycetota bacterium]
MHQHSAQPRTRSAALAWFVVAALVPVMTMTVVTLAGWMQPASRTTASGAEAGKGEGARQPGNAEVTSAVLPTPTGTGSPSPGGQQASPQDNVSQPGQSPTGPERARGTADGKPSVSATSARSEAPLPWAPTPPQDEAVAAASASDRTSEENQILERVNGKRRAQGCKPLELDTRLVTVSKDHAEDMAQRDYFDHTSPDGTSPSDRAAGSGFPHGIGENIAAGYSAAETVMAGWMNSPGHRANILNCAYTVTGIGYDPGSVGTGWGAGSWVQVFGTL